MGLVEILLIAVGLAMDAFAVSLGAGSGGYCRTARPAIRIAFHFGLFQALMPIVGWFLGTSILPLIETIDHWVAFGLLVFVGGRMIRSGLSGETEARTVDPTRGLTLVLLCIATSIDALAVGLSLAMVQVKIWYPAAVIGLVTFGLSLLATRIGDGLSARFGKRIEILGGLILIGIGIRILVSHLLA
ncbi:MAG: manganese efflux pump [Bradymonadales bacterium]|nr:manganese efflux pump [Bradymonadales bacterium]